MEIECIVAYSHVDVFLAKDSILCSTLYCGLIGHLQFATVDKFL